MVRQINGQTALKLSADVIDIDGVVTSLTSKNITVGGITAGSGDFRGCNIDALQIKVMTSASALSLLTAFCKDHSSVMVT
jgi:hypothetical protein